eukprot:m.91200 g.91200  ORF g.91200 m.91200 type:complete len:524 (+) comp15030_c1_seq1:871-2442(+)
MEFGRDDSCCDGPGGAAAASLPLAPSCAPTTSPHASDAAVRAVGNDLGVGSLMFHDADNRDNELDLSGDIGSLATPTPAAAGDHGLGVEQRHGGAASPTTRFPAPPLSPPTDRSFDMRSFESHMHQLPGGRGCGARAGSGRGDGVSRWGRTVSAPVPSTPTTAATVEPRELDISDAPHDGKLSTEAGATVAAECQHGSASFDRGAYAASRGHFLTALAVIEDEGGHLPAEHHVRACLGMACRHMPRALPEALKHHKAQLALAQQMKNPRLICSAHRALANVCFALGQQHLADAVAGAPQPARAAGGSRSRAATDTAQDVAPEHVPPEHIPPKTIAAWKRAVTHFNEQLSIAETLMEPLRIARAHRGLARVYGGLDDHVTARKHAEKYLEAARQCDNRPSILAHACETLVAELRHGQSAWLQTKADFDRLLQLLWEQAAAAESAKDWCSLGRAYFNLASEMDNSGSLSQWYGPVKAVPLFEKAVEAFRKVELKDLGVEGAIMAREAVDRLDGLSAADDSSCSVS